MRISSIPAYRFSSIANRVKPKISEQIPPQPETVHPNFNGCNIFKTAGFILGAVGTAVICPPLAMIGGAGVGAILGGALGVEADKRIDRANGDKDSDGWS